MHISTLNWQQVEAYLAYDDRAVVPLGSTEQHAYLSLSTDSILAERVAVKPPSRSASRSGLCCPMASRRTSAPTPAP